MNNYDELKKNIELIKSDLKNIATFDEVTLADINLKTKNIDRLIEINNLKAKEYQKAEKNKNVSVTKRIDLALDVLSDNFAVVNEKFKMLQFFAEDTYTRIDKLGTSLTRLADLESKSIDLRNQDIEDILKKV